MPRGFEPKVLDLTRVYAIEDRVQEIAYVTPQKAPELLARFNETFLYLHKMVSSLEYVYLEAEGEANRIKSIVLLDRAPEILEKKGLINGKSRAGSEDLRNAVLAQDEEYQSALDIVAQIQCIIELLRGKLKGIEWAFTSVKKILGEGSYNMRLPGPGEGTGSAPIGRVNPGTKAGFGRPVYPIYNKES